jgi:L-malate glycosyltransferase
MRKPVVIILDNSIDVTGALKAVVRTSYDLKNYFLYEFIIPRHSRGRFLMEGKGFSNIHELSLREINKSFVNILLYIPFLFWNAIRLRQIVKQKGISIIHVNDVYNLLPVVLRLLACSVPYVCHIRFMPDRFPSWLFNFWLQAHLRYAVKVVVVSQSVLKQLTPHPKLKVVYDALPLEQKGNEAKFVSQSIQKYFLYLSNFIQGKGHDFALDAFKHVAEHLPEWKLRFVGGDMGLGKNRMYKSKLQEKSKILGLVEKIEWHEFTDNVELEYRDATIVLNFSESESFSMTCVEAMFYQKPIIATDCGGPSEIIDNYETGILVENRNVVAMANAMLQLATNPAMQEQLAVRAAISVRERFNTQNTSLQLKNIYDCAIN